eukprot:CAMPEP_0195300536 /NCGR_PEP_ID=MMETSP0707-20130614/27626_1 /TAXON_ID=33640 /ORGANISM="Asterionellopsis glacialis, Strain CCMP134" /LENGTH=530 /DNA_ID=CAMNT_0040363257 /DNA_START=9 /DNA_END=1602 /DNA_ORIENTATION=-
MKRPLSTASTVVLVAGTLGCCSVTNADKILNASAAPPLIEAAFGELESHSTKGSYWYTAPSVTGNRVVDGQGAFPDGQYVDVEFESEIMWAVATADASGGLRFVVTCVNGNAYTIEPIVSEGGKNIDVVPISEYLPRSNLQPPLVMTDDGLLEVVTLAAATDLSPLSHPVPTAQGRYVYIANNGDLVLWDEVQKKELDRLTDVNALPDGRITEDTIAGTLLAAYGGATDKYLHCVLGDCVEATKLLLFREGQDGLTLVVDTTIELEDGTVFEGMSPLFLEDDQTIVTTVSSDDAGARLQTYDLEGNVVSTGPSNRGYWRHQLFYNCFGPFGKPFLVDVLAPHVLMDLEFFDVSGPEMEVMASVSGYTSHTMGSRNLDAGVSGDLNGDSINEAVIPTDDGKGLVGIQIQQPSSTTSETSSPSQLAAEEVWRIELPAEITSNIAAVNYGKDLAVGVGAGTTFRIWTPPSWHNYNGVTAPPALAPLTPKNPSLQSCLSTPSKTPSTTPSPQDDETSSSRPTIKSVPVPVEVTL